MENNKYILVTGASGGIGEAFAERFACEKKNLILVARRKEKLNEIKKKLEEKEGVIVELIALDLSKEDSAEKMHKEIEKRKLDVHGIVNNAAFGWNGFFKDHPLDNITAMTHINVTTLVKTCRLFVSEMINKKGGFIINVSSGGAFQPMPYYALYAALKACVLNFSIALSEELKPNNIRVFCLCPGETATEFQVVAGDEKLDPKSAGVQTSEEVVDYTLRKLRGKRSFGISGLKNVIMIAGNRFITRQFAAKVGGSMYKPEKE